MSFSRWLCLPSRVQVVTGFIGKQRCHLVVPHQVENETSGHAQKLWAGMRQKREEEKGGQ